MVQRRLKRSGRLFWQEFRAFAIKGNIVDLAVAVVIGGAFGRIINSFVEDILMPLLDPIIPGGNWRESVIGPGIKLGSFAGSALDFLIITLALFLLIQLVIRLSPPPAPPMGECPYCFEKVPVAATKCRACTSELSAVHD